MTASSDCGCGEAAPVSYTSECTGCAGTTVEGCTGEGCGGEVMYESTDAVIETPVEAPSAESDDEEV